MADRLELTRVLSRLAGQIEAERIDMEEGFRLLIIEALLEDCALREVAQYCAMFARRLYQTKEE